MEGVSRERDVAREEAETARRSFDEQSVEVESLRARLIEAEAGRAVAEDKLSRIEPTSHKIDAISARIEEA